MILERKKWSALNGTLIQICSFCHVCHMSIFPTFNFLGHESGRFSRDPQRSSDLRQAWRLPDAFECTHLVIGSLVCCSNLNSCHPICKLACFIADPPSFHIASISERERERETNERKYIGAETRTEARNLWGAYMCRTTSPYPTWAVTWPDSFYSEGLDSRCLSDAWSQAMDVRKNGPSSFASFVRPLNKTKLKHLKTCPLQKEVLL